MRRAAAVAVGLVAVLSSCQRTTSPPVETVPPLTDAQLSGAVLNQADVGDQWMKDAAAEPTTVQIGGRIGPANVDRHIGETTSAFTHKTGPGRLSNTVFLIRSVRLAQAFMRAHRDAATRKTWKQERDDGTTASFTLTGAVKGLPTLGDGVFSRTINVKITDAEEKATALKVEYVVYRAGAILGFVVTQDAGAATYAARQERRVAALLGR